MLERDQSNSLSRAFEDVLSFHQMLVVSFNEAATFAEQMLPYEPDPASRLQAERLRMAQRYLARLLPYQVVDEIRAGIEGQDTEASGFDWDFTQYLPPLIPEWDRPEIADAEAHEGPEMPDDGATDTPGNVVSLDKFRHQPKPRR